MIGPPDPFRPVRADQETSKKLVCRVSNTLLRKEVENQPARISTIWPGAEPAQNFDNPEGSQETRGIRRRAPQMRWMVLAFLMLFMGIQTLRASEPLERKYLRVSCERVGGQELSHAFFLGRESLEQVMTQDASRWSQLVDRCQRKVQGAGGMKWTSRSVVTQAPLSGISEPCVADSDCGASLSCESVAGRCIPAFRISNLPIIY